MIADNAAKSAGVKTFINLADDDPSKQEGFLNSYYSTQKIIALNMDWKFSTENFRQKLKRAIIFMLNNEPPYLIHCNLGKDRTGFVCALLEALMGFSRDEISDDFMLSYCNYFKNFTRGTEEYNHIADDFMKLFSRTITGIKDFEPENFSEAAERYLLSIGINTREISALRKKLVPAKYDSGLKILNIRQNHNFIRKRDVKFIDTT